MSEEDLNLASIAQTIATLIETLLLLIKFIEVFAWPQLLQRSITEQGPASGHSLGALKAANLSLTCLGSVETLVASSASRFYLGWLQKELVKLEKKCRELLVTAF